MPTTKERLDSIETRIERIDIALGLKPIVPPSGLSQAWTAFRGWLNLHKTGVRWAITVVVAIAGWVIQANYKLYLDHKNDAFNAAVDSRVSGALSRPGGVTETLDRVSKTADRTDETLNTLKPFINDVVTHQFENTSKLSTQALSGRLPAVNNLLVVAQDQRLILNRQIAGVVGKNLTHIDTGTQAYWPTAGSLLSATFSESKRIPQKDVNCFTETYPSQPGTLDPLVNRNIVFSDCTLHLDDIEGFANSAEYGGLSNNLLSRNQPFELSLTRVRIVYAGGQPIPFARLTAIDCAFKFDLRYAPTAKGQALVEALLSNFTQENLTINLPASSTAL